MAKKQIPNIDAGDLIAKRDTRKASTLVRTLVGGEDTQTEAAPRAGKGGGASTTDKESNRYAGRPKTTQRKRTTIYIDEVLLDALRRERYENNKDATQVINEALYRYFGL